MVTSVIELADKLYKYSKENAKSAYKEFVVDKDSDAYDKACSAIYMSVICSNANDIGLPLSVVEQLLKGTDYEQLLS